MRTAEQIRAELKELIADQQKCDVAQIKDDACLSTELGLDSLDVIYLMMNVEERFATSICEKDFRSLRTLGEAVEFLGRVESEQSIAVSHA